MTKSFRTGQGPVRPMGDYQMRAAPFDLEKSNCCEFTHCPVSEFAQKHDLPEVMPALCDPDDTAMELIHARLVQTIYTNSDRCDYAICRDRNHPEYKNEAGYRRNR